jgi:hypothetical protein
VDAVSACRSCRAEIWWAETLAGKRIPVDAEPAPDGNVVLLREGHGEAPPVVRVTSQAQADTLIPDVGTRYVSHYATCPQAAEWRKRRG